VPLIPLPPIFLIFSSPTAVSSRRALNLFVPTSYFASLPRDTSLSPTRGHSPILQPSSDGFLSTMFFCMVPPMLDTKSVTDTCDSFSLRPLLLLFLEQRRLLCSMTLVSPFGLIAAFLHQFFLTVVSYAIRPLGILVAVVFSRRDGPDTPFLFFFLFPPPS